MELTQKEKLSNMFVEDFEVKHTFSKDDDLYEISIKWVHDLGVEYPQVTIIKKLNSTNTLVIYDEELVTEKNYKLNNELSALIDTMLQLLKSKIS